MLTLVLRRARVQRRLLTAVVLLVATAAALVGVCSQLLVSTQDRAFHMAIERTRAQDVDVTAFLGEITGRDLAHVRAQARDVVVGVLAPMHPTVTSTAAARMRRLGVGDRLAYLATDDALPRRAALVSGRWPVDAATGPAQAAVPESTARLLGLTVGDHVRLGGEIGLEAADNAVTVVVVGTFRPRAGAGWGGDPLAGAGYDPAYSDGAVTAPAYGPFVVGDASFLASGSSVSRLRVTAHPDLTLAEDSSLRAAVDSVDHASELLSSRVGKGAHITRVGSDLSSTLGRVHAQQASTRATVLVVLLLGSALSLAAVLLAGWLVAAVREEERALLVTLGLSRRQRICTSLLEALVLATVAALLALPAAAAVHSWLTHLPDLTAAGLTQSPTVPPELVVAVVGSVVILTLVLVLAVPDDGGAVPPAPRWTLARSILDLLLLAVAGVAWWQLRAQPATTAPRGDVTVTVAPVLCLAAVTLVAVRLIPPLLAAAARAGTRSRGLALPLAAGQAARRPHRGTAMVLVAAAVATAVFGLALRTTWERSQRDQAALRVGTDLSLALPAPAGPQDAAAVAAATADGSPAHAVSPVVDRPLALGRYVGEAGSPPMIVALDTRHAGALLRGRLEPGTTWGRIGARLAPHAPVRGLPLPGDGDRVELEGRAPAGVTLAVTPTAVVQDPAGFRSSVLGDPLPLDGRRHAVAWRSPLGSGQLVGLRLDVDGVPPEDPGPRPEAPVSVTLRLPSAGTRDVGRAWRLDVQRDSPVRGATVAVGADDSGSQLQLTAGVDLPSLAYADATLLATAFPETADIPVAVSQQLVDAVGVEVGGELSAIVDDVALALRVVAIVPSVPSVPGQAAVMADEDTLSRALIDAGRLDPVVDGWWVGRPAPSTVSALRSLELGDVTTRPGVAAALARGPLRVTTPTAVAALVVAATALLLAGVGLLLSADRQRRSAEVARLRALGLTRRDARRVLLAEHAAFLVPLVLVGALVGVAAAAVLGPLLVRSDLGAAPVPGAVVAWPWRGEVLLVAGMLAGTWAITAVATAIHVQRSDPAHLRTGEG